MSDDFTFDRKALRYRRANGRFLSRVDMLSLLDQLNNKSSIEIQDQTDRLIEGQINLTEWLNSVAQKLKTVHIQQYLLGRGGEAMLVDSDYSAIADRVKSEFGYLKGFARAIRDDRLSPAQIKARIQLYVNATDQTRKLAERQGNIASGKREERRVLAQVKHCAPCIAHAAKGWQPIGTLPAIGQSCDCHANCRCSFEYRMGPPRSRAVASILVPRAALDVTNPRIAGIDADHGLHR